MGFISNRICGQWVYEKCVCVHVCIYARMAYPTAFRQLQVFLPTMDQKLRNIEN
jgi:hypothetical protein